MASRIDAILDGIRKELERRPQAFEGGGLESLAIHLYFNGGDGWNPRKVTVAPEFSSAIKSATGVE